MRFNRENKKRHQEVRPGRGGWNVSILRTYVNLRVLQSTSVGIHILG